MTEFTHILQKVSDHFNEKIPFVIYSLPGSKNVTAYLQKDTELYATKEFEENCFVFAPFD